MIKLSMMLHSFSISFRCKNIWWIVGIACRSIWVRVWLSVETLPDFPCSIMCSLRCYSNHTVSKQKALSTRLLLLRFLDVLSICVACSYITMGVFKAYRCETAEGNMMWRNRCHKYNYFWTYTSEMLKEVLLEILCKRARPKFNNTFWICIIKLL